jgi:hypothetical protein
MGAGPNYYTDDPDDIWIDQHGNLHLNIVEKESNWYCSEVFCNENLGYGTYVFTLENEIDSLDSKIILGLFIYDLPDQQGNHREIDVELTRWGNPSDPNNSQFVVQPWNNPGNIHRFPIDYAVDTEITTHEITWLTDQIDFRSYYGESPFEKLDYLIESWSYSGSDIPQPGTENPRINFYLMNGDPPTNSQDAEIVIRSLEFFPNIEAEIDLDDTLNLASNNRWIKCSIKLNEGYRIDNLDFCCIFLEDSIKAEQIKIKKQQQLATAKFDCEKLKQLLSSEGQPNVELTVRGQLIDGTRFIGKDKIKLVSKK